MKGIKGASKKLVGTTMAGQRLLEGAHTKHAPDYGLRRHAVTTHSPLLPHSPNCPSDFLLWCTIYCRHVKYPGPLVPRYCKLLNSPSQTHQPRGTACTFMVRLLANTVLYTEGRLVASFQIIRSLPIAAIGILKMPLSTIRIGRVGLPLTRVKVKKEGVA